MFTIIVVVFGKVDYKKLLSSIYKSSYKKFEVIIVNNNKKELNISTKKYKKIRVINLSSNTGIFAYNVGFSNARGDYILVLDVDTFIEKDTLKNIASYFFKNKKNVGILTFNVYNFVSKKHEWEHYFLNSPSVPTFAGGACCFRKEVFKKVGFYDERFFCWGHEDDFSLRAMDKEFDIHFLEKVKIGHMNDEEKIRPLKLFLTFRNKAWVNLKHFYIWMIPFQILRDLWFVVFFYDNRFVPKRIFFSTLGYVTGYLTFWIPISKRKPVNFYAQKKFTKHYLLGRFEEKINI